LILAEIHPDIVTHEIGCIVISAVGNDRRKDGNIFILLSSQFRICYCFAVSATTSQTQKTFTFEFSTIETHSGSFEDISCWVSDMFR
jgi:hypothetical protein